MLKESMGHVSVAVQVVEAMEVAAVKGEVGHLKDCSGPPQASESKLLS